MSTRETYLGDGLYASFDGFMIILRAPREDGSHHVGLEPDVLEAFERYVAQLRGVPRADAEAIAAVPELKGKNAVVLYFETPEDRDELVALIKQEKPGMRAVNIP